MSPRVFLFSIGLLLFNHVAAILQWNQNSMAFALSSAVTSGSNVDLYMNMSAPTSAGWAGLGIGNGMAGALMFVIYPTGNGSVTVSVRSSSGHVMPRVLSGVDYQVISSQIANGNMIASFVCKGCQQWNGGSLDMTDSSQPWIWALGPGSTVSNGNSVSAQIQQHRSFGSFNVAMPMTNSNSSTSSIPTIQYMNAYTLPNSNAGSSNNGGSDTNTGTELVIQGDGASTPTRSVNDNLVTAHAVLLGISFVFMYPIGMILLRLPSRFFGVWVHAGWQSLTTCLVIAGFIIALYFSLTSDRFHNIDKGHQILGIVTIGLLLLFQPLLGLIHHIRYKRIARRTLFGWVHLGLGRVLIAAGMVNVCLGFWLDNSTGGTIAAAVVSAAVIVIVEVVLLLLRRHKARKETLRSETSEAKILTARAVTVQRLSNSD